MKNLRIALSLLLFALCPPDFYGQTNQAALDKDLQQLYANSKFPGFCAAIVNQDKVLYQNGFGWADVEKKLPFTANTVQPVGSVSKTLIGVALLKAVEQGHFTLETNVNDLLPFKVSSPNFPDKPIKIRHLATHTSGILDREEIYAKAYIAGLKRTATLREYLNAYLSTDGKNYSKNNFAKSEPGAAFNYTNIGATLAAYLIEVKASLSYAEYTQKYILNPLRMNDSGWDFDAQNKNNATLYDGKNKTHAPYSLLTYPDGGLRTSCGDLGKYLVAVLQNSPALLTKESFRTMLSPQFSADKPPQNIDPKEPNQGIFWQFRRNGTIGHSGSDPGVAAFMVFNPKTATGRVFLTNVGLEDEGSAPLIPQFAAVWKTLESYEPKLSSH